MKHLTIFTLFLTIATFTSCTVKNLAAQLPMQDGVKTIQYKNFQGEIDSSDKIAIVRKSYENGKLVSVKNFNKEDKLIEVGSYDTDAAEWKFEYDENGNYIQQTAHNAQGEICDVLNWSDSAYEIFTYNEENQLIERANYDKDMKLIGLGDINDASQKIGYNDKGQVIWTKSYGPNKNFIKNGFCYSKYEYLENGKLKKHTYLYDENKVNSYSLFTYESNKVTEESYNEKNEKEGYEIYHYDDDGKIISKEKWYHKWDAPIVKNEKLELKIDGWKIKKSDFDQLKFEHNGDGQYNVKINEQGEIIDMSPIKYKSARAILETEIYEKFKNIKLERDKEVSEVKLEGVLEFDFLHQLVGSFYTIDLILNPEPGY